MKCNACWRSLEERAVATSCGHIFCNDDASRILNSDSTCPLCDQVLSKSNMKAVDLSPKEEWINMVMAGVPPQSIMKSAFKGVVFWISQVEVEGQLTIQKAMHLKQKYEEMQAKYMEKLEQLHGAYQKAMHKVQVLEQEKENLVKDINELQEKYTEKSRQKRKLEEMYKSLRSEFEQLKQGGLAPVAKPSGPLVPRTGRYSFAQAQAVGLEPTSLRPTTTSDLFDMPNLPPSMGRLKTQSPAMGGSIPHSRKSPSPFRPADANTGFGAGTMGRNSSNALRNLLLSPMKRPPSRLRPSMLSR